MALASVLGPGPGAVTTEAGPGHHEAETRPGHRARGEASRVSSESGPGVITCAVTSDHGARDNPQNTL